MPFCINDALTSASGGYHRFCLGYDAARNALLAIDAIGGASTKTVKVSINGTVYDLLGSPNPYVAPTDVYISPSGNDGSDCRTVGTACHTATRALAAGTLLLNSGGNSLNINFAAGSYNESFFDNQPLPGGINAAANPNGSANQPGQVMLVGAGSGVTTMTAGSNACGTILASNFATVGIRRLRLLGNAFPCQSTLFAQINGMINIYDDVDFGPASVEQIHIENAGSQVQAWYSYTISGGAARHVLAASNGLYINSAFPSGVITHSGNPVFTDAWAVAAENGVVQFNSGVSFAGTGFTGKRFDANTGGVIDSYVSRSLAWIPGTIAGTQDTGGAYYGPFMATLISRAGSLSGVLIQGDSGDVQINTQAPGTKFLKSDSGIIASSGSICGASMAGDNATSSFDAGGTNCNLQLAATGTGFVQIATNNSVAFNAAAPLGGVNALQANGATTGGAPVLSAIGTDSSIGIVLQAKANGTVAFGTSNIQITTLQTPASSSAACVIGTINVDASFIYLCTATNTWKRASLASF